MSKNYETSAWKVDAFSFRWVGRVYLFPPIILISQVVQKFIADEVEQAVLITPDWSGLPCLHLLVDLLISDPIALPAASLRGKLPLPKPFDVVAWNISSLPVLSAAYRKLRRERCSKAYPRLPSLHTSGRGPSLAHGLQSMGISLCPLLRSVTI